MNERIIELSLDLNCKTNGPVIHLTQFDKGVSIHLSATLDGAFFSLSGTTVVLKGIDARKGQVLLDCHVNADGTATATTLDSTFSEDGVAVCKFIISDTTKTYATQSFLVDVDDSLDAEIHDDRYSLLGKLIREILLMDERGGILVDEELDATSIHPVQNKVIVEALSHLVEYVTVTTADAATKNGTIYYVNGSTEKYTLIPTSTAARQVQLRIDSSGRLLIRKRYAKNSGVFPAWGSWTDISAAVDPAVIRQIIEAYIEEHGIADGKSAYEIDVEHGYEGTETEWLESLHGADGAPGAKGDKGDAGDKGERGIKGDSITAAYRDSVSKHLVLTRTVYDENGTASNTPIDVGAVNGRHGNSLQNVSINSNGELETTIRVYDDIDNYNDMIGNLGRVVGADGAKGDKGDPGDDYVLTEQDKSNIAEITSQRIMPSVSTLNACTQHGYVYTVTSPHPTLGLYEPPFRVLVAKSGTHITQYIFSAKGGADNRSHLYIREGEVDSGGAITFYDQIEEMARRSDITEITEKMSEEIKPFIYNGDYVVYTDGTVNLMSFHSSSDNSKVNELYCSPIGQLDVTGWSSYTNLTTVYINANEDDIEIIGTIPQNVICYYREGTNSEYFLTENIIVKALSSLLKLKADKSTTLEGYGITDGETTSHKVTAITSGANNTMYPSALAVYNALSGKESTSNKSTSVGSGSSHTQYPTSKAVYDYVTTVIQGKADKSDTYTKSEVDAAIQTAIGTIETQLSQV